MLVKGPIIWCVVLTCLFAAVLAELQCSVPGQCVNSDLIQSEVEEDKYACHHQCKTNDACYWFTYNQEKGFCEQFGNCFNITDATCDTCITSEKDCDVYQCSLQGSCQVTISNTFLIVLC